MAKPVLTYSPSDVTIIICGFTLTGIVSASMQWHTRPFTMIKGIRGINTRCRSLDTGGTLVIELLQTSPSNSALFQILQQDRVNQSARLDVTLADTAGGSIIYSDSAYVSAFPNYDYSMGFDNRYWEIELLEVRDEKMNGESEGFIDLLGSGVDYLQRAFT